MKLLSCSCVLLTEVNKSKLADRSQTERQRTPHPDQRQRICRLLQGSRSNYTIIVYYYNSVGLYVGYHLFNDVPEQHLLVMTNRAETEAHSVTVKC